jgi:hypothetical protein
MQESAPGRNAFVALLLIPETMRWHALCTLTFARRSRGRCSVILVQSEPVRELRVKLAATQQLHGYWRDLKGGRSAPERNDIDPGVIRGVLADTFIMECEPAGGFPLRIVGTRTNALFQRELRGQPFLDLWKRSDRPEVKSLVESVADEAQAFLVGAAGGPSGVEPIDVEMLLLPLRHRGATHSRLLGSCAPHRMPEWLGLLPIGAISLISLRAIRDEDSRPGAPPGFRRSGRPTEIQRRGHLVVYSNDS